LNAGARAARLINPDIKLLLHYDAGGGGTGMFDSYASRTSTPLATEVDFDVCGLSWYPYYGSHGTLQALRNNIAILRTRYLYPKEVAVVEAGYAWTSAFDNDDMPNLFHTKEEELSAQSIPENSPYAAGSNIVYEHRDGTNTLYIPASPHNQAAVFRTIINAINDGGGMGIFWWAADWIAYPGLQSNWDNQAAFDFNGKALPALAVWSIKGASE
jgi:arabinogalactan endo-1,4-beta-galactosidase